MWVQAVLVAAFSMILFMLMRTKGKDRKLNNEADGSRNAVLGPLQTLELALSFIAGKIPNYELAANWTQACGGLLIMNMPTKNTSSVCITDMQLAKGIMNSSAWISRLPDKHYLYSCHFNKPLGLLFGNDQWWKESRKLTMKLLHQLDFFRLENMERIIAFEIAQVKSDFDEQLSKSKGGAITVRMQQRFQLHTLNIVYQVIMGKRFEEGDPIAEEIIRRLRDFHQEFNLGTSVLDIFPWLMKIPGLSFMDSYKKASQVFYEYFKKEVADKRRESGTYRTAPSDFADYFLLEIDKRSGENPCYLTDESLLVTMRDMVFAGSDPTNCAMENGILRLSLQPEIQKKVQAEIDHVIGHNRSPSYADKLKMPYTQAVLLEILRDTSPVPLTARSPLADNQLNGNFIPKGSVCAVNVYAIHRSPDLWDDPKDFRPERFLNEQGEIVNTEKIMPFGHGKRLCVGESVARPTLFIFFVSLLQKYSFQVSDKHPPPSLKNAFGLARCPLPYYVVNVRARFQ